MLVWTIFHVLVFETRAQNLPAPFSYITTHVNITVSFRYLKENSRHNFPLERLVLLIVSFFIMFLTK